MGKGDNHKAPKRAWRVFAIAFMFALVVAIGAPIVYSGEPTGGHGNPLASLLGAPAADAAPSDGEASDADTDDIYEPNQVIVTIPEGASLEEVEDTLTSLDYVATEELTEENIVDNYVLLDLEDGVDVDWAQNELAAEEVVETTQPNFVYHLFVDDPYATDNTKEQFGALNVVHAFEAWEEVTCDNTVSIAVLDTGVDLDHEDLVDNIIQEAGYNAQNPSKSADDDHTDSHGTHVAGIAAATANNDKGVAGYSYNANIIPIKVLSSTGGGTTMDVLRALSYVNTCREEHPEYNIRVLNMSFGNNIDKLEDADVATIREMEALNDKGVLVVAAAGNSNAGEPPYRCWPGDYSDNILNVMNARSTSSQVGGIDQWNSYALNTGSNYNEAGSATKDIVAPGTRIMSTVNSGGYTTKSGTSMASPAVAGVAALLFAADPDLTPGEVNDILCSTATDMGSAGFDQNTGYGLVNAEAAVKMAKAGTSIGGETSILQGSTTTLSLSGLDGAAWSSSDGNIATVEGGQVTGVGEGYAVITATGTDGTKLSHTIAVYNPTLEGANTLETGNSTTFSLATTMPGAWEWESSNTDVATIDTSGLATAVSPGTTTISIHLATNPDVKAEMELTVTKPDITNATVTGVKDMAYTGKAVTQNPTVTLNGRTLVAGTDYELDYRDNIEPGTATMTATGKGAYRGSKDVTFEITPANISDAVVAEIPSWPYTGTPIKPELTVTLDEKNLERGKDYEVSYGNNVNAGTATATVTGKGNYSGTTSATFQIAPADISTAIVAPIADQAYANGDAVEPSVTVQIGDKVLVPAVDYYLSYENNREIGEATVVVHGIANYSGQISATYHITDEAAAAPVRAAIEALPSTSELTLDDADAVAAARAAYDALTGDQKALVDASALEAAEARIAELREAAKPDVADATVTGVRDMAYTGKAVTQNPTVTLGGRTLVNGTDYALSYKDNVSQGTATMTVTGKGAYRGSKDVTFKITAPAKNGWVKEAGKWRYYRNNAALKGWQKISGTWYYLRPSDGVMLTGWQKVGGKWYYLDSNGAMLTGWQKISGTWYYLKSSGAMAASEWCGGYWLNASGSWTYQYKASWKKDSTGWWYGDTSGWYARSATYKIDDKNYTFNARGYWV